ALDQGTAQRLNGMAVMGATEISMCHLFFLLFELQETSRRPLEMNMTSRQSSIKRIDFILSFRNSDSAETRHECTKLPKHSVA
ncbi:MAG: hypothetical protein AAFX07_15895, partial [Pseudomonadota bacterium]